MPFARTTSMRCEKNVYHLLLKLLFFLIQQEIVDLMQMYSSVIRLLRLQRYAEECHEVSYDQLARIVSEQLYYFHRDKFSWCGHTAIAN